MTQQKYDLSNEDIIAQQWTAVVLVADVDGRSRHMLGVMTFRIINTCPQVALTRQMYKTTQVTQAHCFPHG